MEVVALNGGSNTSPFRHEVHEWQHIDSKTGALLSGRAVANRYVNGNLNTYGKSLLQSFETTDGTQHKQHKQMNILQTITPTGGALQVVRAQTIQTSHSSSRRAAITSTTYSSQYTNGGATANSTTSTMNGDLLSINPRVTLHHHDFQQHAQPASTSSSRLKALLSSAVSEGNSKTHLFHQKSSGGSSSNLNNNSHDTDQPMMMKNGVGSIQEYSRQQQINEMLFGSTANNEESFKKSHHSNSLLRGKSASIEELANIINDSENDDDDVKPYDWKRVSKIRRSLQFPKTSERRFNYSARPADLPENSVNVWKLRQDIEKSENERRLSNGTMKTAAISSNNNINFNNFVALDSILKESSSPLDSLSSNHSQCKGGVDAEESAKSDLKSDCVTAESLQEIRRRLRKLNATDFISSTSNNSNGDVSQRLLTVDEITNGNHLQKSTTVEQNCKSLELRKNKERDNNDDWSNRRKSYGFEKMLQPSESSSSSFGGTRIESSTDSGLGRSSDLPSNWSPTVDTPQRTIITFGDKTKPTTTSISLFSNSHALKQETVGDSNSTRPKPVPMRRRSSIEKKDELKRHSIAVDEKIDEHYQQRNGSNDRKISLVNLNGSSHSNAAAIDKLPQLTQASIAAYNDGRQKKVEFCKTEIHFAAESGRVNIVETDEKPPPTNNFRRRRRNSGTEYSTQQQQIDFDDETERHLEDRYDAAENNVTTTIGSIYSSAKEDETDEGHSDTDGLRGILKNKPVKPKPYHLGENLKESGSSLWGVKLKPVENQHTTWRHSAELESVVTGKKLDDALEDEFKNLVKAIDEDEKHNGNVDHHQSSTFISNGYSTKINLSSMPTIQQHPAVANNNHKAPLTALYENATTSVQNIATQKTASSKPLIEATPRTSMTQIESRSNQEKVNIANSNLYSNIQQDNSVKVNIQNFESLSPALSRSNSLRIKKDNAKDESLKITTGTRQLKAHELTYFGVKSSPVTTTNATDSNNIIISTNKSPFMHLSTSNKSNILSSIKATTTTTTSITNNSNNSSKITVNHHQKPDLIMHHQQKYELTPSEKKSMIEALDNCIDETKNLEPLYENLYQNNKHQQPYNRKLDLKRDEKILDELTRAADEIMNTCKEMYNADSEEKKRKSLLLTSTSTCLETINEGAEGRQQQQKLHQYQLSELDEQPKIMKSKGVQVSRNFEDSLRRYHRMQQRTSSQSSIESLPRNSKISSSSSAAVITTRTRRVKNGESAASTASTTVSSSTSSRKRENGNSSGDASKRTITRVCSRERMHKSNASSSESDLPNSSTEVPRRPRRTKVLKHRDENGKNDEKKSSRTAAVESSNALKKKTEHGSSSVSKESRIRSSGMTKSSSSTNPNTSLSSPSHNHRVNGTTGGLSSTTSSSRKSRR